MEITIHNAISDKDFMPVNIGIENGKFAVVTSEEIQPGEMAIDAKGTMVSPPFFESHFHLENALLWGVPNHSGTLHEAVKIYADWKKSLDTPNIVERASIVLRDALSNGVLWLRNHVDIDHIAGLRLLKGVTAAQEKFQGILDVYNIAFPQMGMACDPEVIDLMWASMENGANIVGGIPHAEKNLDDAARHIEIAFEIAKKYNADIDMHIDETDDPYWISLELLAEKTIQENYQGRVNASHCCAMAAWDQKTLERILPKVKAADITIVTNVPVNLIGQGQADSPPTRRGTPRLAEILAAGINLACGQDDVQNMFYPYGNMDPLEVANFVAHAGYFTTTEKIQAAFDMPRYNAAKGFGVKDYGIHVGKPANLVLIPAANPVEAIRKHPPRFLVMREGKVLVTTEYHRRYATAVV